MPAAFIHLRSRLALWLIGMLLAAAHTVTAADLPNIVLIISDDHAWTDYSFMGHPVIRTPHIDRLASQSLTFTRGYVPDSLCRPSLATIITGLYPHQHNIVGNDPAPPPGMLPWQVHDDTSYDEKRRRLIARIDDLPTLPRLLGELGYVSHQSGKWWEGGYARGGFTEGMTRGFGNHPQGRHGDEGLTIGREGLAPVTDFIDRAAAADKPFFVWYAPFLPHTPHTPPQRLLDQYVNTAESIHVARYRAMVAWFDETCGELLAHLDARGVADNTIVIYLADNGWIQDPEAARYAPRSKRTFYEGGIRTPIMIRWPARVTPRRDDATPVSSIDIAPTLLNAAGLGEATQSLPGVNLLDADAIAARPAIFGAIFEHDIQDLDDPVASLRYRWIICGPYKFVMPDTTRVPNDYPRLYDLIDDPHERRTLNHLRPDDAARLSGMLNRWWSRRPDRESSTGPAGMVGSAPPDR